MAGLAAGGWDEWQFRVIRAGLVFCFFFFNINLFIYLYWFLAALGLRCCTQAFSSCGELLFAVVRGLLIAVASLVAEHGL